MPIEKYIFIGAGGHAKVVVDAFRVRYPEALFEVRDDDPARHAMMILGFSVEVPIGPLEGISAPCHVAIGMNATRRSLGRAIAAAGGNLESVIHPHARVSSYAVVHPGSFVAAGAVVAADATVGTGGIINHCAIVDHDCVIGDWAHIAPGAVLGGAVRIGEACLIGSGAVVLPGVTVGDGAVVGAGAVVTRDVPPRTTALGIPAKRRK